MSIWTPVISYNISWAKEIIKNWINWYLVDSDSEFIERSYEVLINSQLRKNLSIEAIKTSKMFSEYIFKEQLSKIL
jgi:glycosyltransferase involved in cell wall biosynthesis